MDAADRVEIMRSIYCLYSRSTRTITQCTNETESITRLNLSEWKASASTLKSNQREFFRNMKIQLAFRSYSHRFKHIFGVTAAVFVSAYLIMSTIPPVEWNRTTGFIPFLVFKCFVQNRSNNKQRALSNGRRKTYEPKIVKCICWIFVHTNAHQTLWQQKQQQQQHIIKNILPVLRALAYFYYYCYFIPFVSFLLSFSLSSVWD